MFDLSMDSLVERRHQIEVERRGLNDKEMEAKSAGFFFFFFVNEKR